jgi:opacity protein-like surface antigen
MWNLARCTVALLIASFASAHGASALMEEDEGDASEFVRTGFYLGAGGTAAFPHHWNSDFDGHLNGEATDLANQNAQGNLDAILNAPVPPLPPQRIIPLSVTVDGADLEDAQFGVNGVIGYRAGALVAFEVEGEWLISSNKTDLDVNDSTGSDTAEVDKVWTITANVKVYPPFTGWLQPFARFQPFAKVGLGIQNSELDVDIATSGLTTTNQQPEPNPPPLIVVPADFRIKENKTNLEAALRVGGGIDIYATRNIVSEINATYVVPFSDVGFVNTDYVSVQWRLVYRF